MNAAVVTAFGEPPRYSTFAVPTPHTADESLVDVLAVGLHPRTRSGAAGTHYTSSGVLPMIPGVDGVGRRADGTLLYFVSNDDTIGTMAEQAVADARRSVELPADADPALIAAAMNPAMSSWVALRRRAPLRTGQDVLVLGATGNAGTMAVQIAKHLGAGRVVGAGRDADRLRALRTLGADDTVRLTDDAEATSVALGAAAADVDVVIDYLWGAPAHDALLALLATRTDRSRQLTWIQIGSVAGPTMELPSAALRSANLHLVGNGQGAVSPAAYAAELPSLVDEIRAGSVTLSPDRHPLAEVETLWARPDAPGQRTVLVP